MKQVSISLTDKEWLMVACALREVADLHRFNADDPDMETDSRHRVKQLASELDDTASVIEIWANTGKPV